jgi:hypothetical protein
LKRVFFITFVLFQSISLFSQQRKYTISGTVFEQDSANVMPFVNLINMRNGNGTITDYNGKFTLIAQNNDTLVFSYLGFARKKIPVAQIKNLTDSTKKPLKVVMQRIMVTLATATAFATKYKQNEIDYMKRYSKEHKKMTILESAESPITALYNQFSRKGKEQRKLREIFERILTEEEVAKKFNPEILRQLTEDEFVDYERFRKYCWYVTDEYILSHEGYDLYAPIMDCYRRWKADGK